MISIFNALSRMSEQEIEALLNQLEKQDAPREQQAILVELDELIKQNKHIREETPELFYRVLQNKIQLFISLSNSLFNCLNCTNFDDENTKQEQIETLKSFILCLKCLKNSAAAFKTSLKNSERNLCESLIEFLAVKGSWTELELNETSDNSINTILLFIWQYFFNLMQGNQIAYDTFLNKWLSVAFRFLSSEQYLNKLNEQMFHLLTMFILYATVENKKQDDSMLSDYFSQNQITFLNLLNKTFNFFVNETIKESQTSNEYRLTNEKHDELDLKNNCAFQLCDFSFRFFFNQVVTNFNTNRKDSFSIFNAEIKTRINFLKLLNFNLNKKETFHNEVKNKTNFDQEKNFVEFSSLESTKYLIDYHKQQSAKLIDSIEAIQLNDLDLNEIKLICACLSDVLILNRKPTQLSCSPTTFSLTADEKLQLAQTDSCLLENTCHLFKLLFNDQNDYIKQLKAYYNLKCELIRLIGILVYENLLNQKKLVDLKILHLISANLNFDSDNPFLREWCLISLKHILSMHDLCVHKQEN